MPAKKKPNHTSLWRRFLSAYWTTFVVLASYSSLRITGFFMSESQRSEALARRHVVNARRIERTISALGGLFIKVGQLFSILTNFLPPAFRAELEGLQDSVEPIDYSAIRTRLIEELGRQPEEVFKVFSPSPLASASLGQVHRATLHNGEEVAVKVQIPGIEELVQADLRILRHIVKIVGRYMRTQNLGGVYREVEKMVLQELDFEREATSLTQIRANLAGNQDVMVPKVFEEFSTQRLLVLEFVLGTKVTELAKKTGEEALLERRRTAEILVHAYSQQIFEHGFYHADPHPGNVLVTPEGRVVLVDFGAVAELSQAMRDGIVELLHGVLTADTDRIIESLRSMGFVQRAGGTAQIERVVYVLHDRLQGAIQMESVHLKDIRIDPSLVIDTMLDLERLDIGLKELSEAFHIPSQWILLERTILMLAGVCTTLDEDLKPMDVLRPYVERMVLDKAEDWSSFAVETAKQLGVQLATLPADFKRVLGQAARGELTTRSRSIDVGVKRLTAVGHQLIWTLLAIGSAAISTVYDLAEREASASRWSWASLVFGLALARSLMVHSRRKTRP